MSVTALSELMGRWRTAIEAHPLPLVLGDVLGPRLYSREAERWRPFARAWCWPEVGGTAGPEGGPWIRAFECGDGLLYTISVAPPTSMGSEQLASLAGPDELVLVTEGDGTVCGVTRAAEAVLGEVIGRHLLTVLAVPTSLYIGTGVATLQWVGRRCLRWTSHAVTIGTTLVFVFRALDLTEVYAGELALNLSVRRTEVLRSISQAIGADASMVDVARLVAARLVQLLPLRHVRVSMWGLQPSYLLCNLDGFVVQVPERPVVADALRRGASELLIGVERMDMTARAAGMRAALLLPLRVSGEVEGALELYTDLKESFDQPEIGLAQAVAALMSTAMVRAQASDRLARHAEALERRLRTLNEEIHHTQRALAQAERLSRIGELSASAIHEMRQPLHVISGYMELIESEALDATARARAFDVLRRAVERMASQIEGLREGSGDTGVASARARLRQVVDLGRELTAGAGGPRVRVEVDDLEVAGDQGQLEQVLTNLLANALQAGPGPVSVRGFSEGGQVVIEVEDEGRGVPDALKERIFEPLFTTRSRGMGLGLAVSRRIVAQHGGRISLRDGPQCGTIFRIELPEPGGSPRPGR